MINRKQFIKWTALGSLFPSIAACETAKQSSNKTVVKPVVISTWNHGIAANAAAAEILEMDGRALDAVEAGVRVTEADESVSSVGIGGWPDRDGNVTLDACIMDEKLNCGSVAFVKNIKHVISLARVVMEKTPHVMIVGEGAQQLAKEHGFKEENLLTESSKKAYKEWLAKSKYQKMKIDKDNHDTIGLLALDKHGNLSGACTTSGMAWKHQGRVGDSPIIGAGLYSDNAVGAATATGKGEAVIRIVGSYMVVELMRQGKSPQEACEAAVRRIISSQPDFKDFQVGFIALNKFGETGSYCIQKGFQYAVYKNQKNELFDSDYEVKS